MLRLGKLTDYAVVVLSTLVARTGSATPVSQIASAAGLPEPTVSKIMKQLAKADLVVSERGINGGYRLKGAPATLPVIDIITAMEGPVSLTACVEGSDDSCALEGVCAMHRRWTPVNNALKSALSKITLAEMMRP